MSEKFIVAPETGVPFSAAETAAETDLVMMLPVDFIDTDDDDARCCLDDDIYCDDIAEEVEAEPALAPEKPLPGKGVLVATHNRIGRCMADVGAEHGVEVAAALAIWKVECGPFAHVPGHAIIRFENHRFWKLHGKAHPAEYAKHFRHGAGKMWLDHRFHDGRAWLASHASGQKVEYAALARATALAGDDIALRCISIGGPQILCSNFELLGYGSPSAMHDAFQTTEDVHVRGFFAFCEAKGLITAMQEKRWRDFAKVYNGPGQPDLYGGKIADAYRAAKTLLAGAA